MRPTGTLIASLNEVLTREHPSRIDPYLRWARTPPAALALATTAAGLCGLYLHPRAFVVAGVLVSILAIGAAWPHAAVFGIQATLTFARSRVREGESVEAILSVRNRSPWSVWGLIVQCETPGWTDPPVSINRAAGWCATTARREIIPRVRGEHPGHGARIATAFPFGVLAASRTVTAPSPLLVWPRSFPVGPLPEATLGRDSLGNATTRKPGTVGDLLGVRPYRRGDPLRRIHWPQSARHGNLVVCEVEAAAVPSVQIVLDTDTAAHAGDGPDGSFEWAVRLVASFAEAWLAESAQVEVVHGSRSIAAAEGPVGRRKARVLDALARVRFEAGRPLADVLAGPACTRFSGGLRLIVATDLALSRLPSQASHGPVERSIALQASAFAGEKPAPRPDAPSQRLWLWVNDPTRVPELVRCRGKGVDLEC